MLRIVVDTNVVVSAFLTPNGNPARILDQITDQKLQICYNQEILTEYVEVLSRPRFKFSKNDCDNFIQGIKEFGRLVKPSVSNIPLLDEDDRCFYDVAKFCEAILITGNIKHFPTEQFIITPAEFLGLVL